MKQPGARLRAVAARLFDRPTMERLIDPVVADLQCEHAEAVRHGRTWRARWLRIASGIAFCKVAALAVFTSDSHRARAIAVGLSTAIVLTTLAILSALAGTPATIAARGKMLWLVVYLVPQALAISLPVCMALGVFIWIRGDEGDPATKRTVLWLMRLAMLLAVANTGWITPAANTAYRDVVAGVPTLRGVNELTFIELGRQVSQGGSRVLPDGQLPMVFWLNTRLALVVAPVLLGVLALAGAAAPRRAGAIIVFTTLALFAVCYVLVTEDEIATLMRWLPAAAIAWIPNALAMIATLSVAAGRRSRQA